MTANQPETRAVVPMPEPLDLDAIETRVAERVNARSGDVFARVALASRMADVDVPALVAEVRALRAALSPAGSET